MKEMRRMVQLLKVLTASVLIITWSLKKKIGLKLLSLIFFYSKERERESE